MTKDNELRPCPFCGGDVSIGEIKDGSVYIGHTCGEDSNNVFMYVNDRYLNDGAPESFEEELNKTIKNWNTRPVSREEAQEVLDIIDTFGGLRTDNTTVCKRVNETIRKLLEQAAR